MNRVPVGGSSEVVNIAFAAKDYRVCVKERVSRTSCGTISHFLFLKYVLRCDQQVSRALLIWTEDKAL